MISQIQSHFDMKDKYDNFEINFGEESERPVNFTVKGVKRELGQTLYSTGLTVWRAAYHLCEYIYQNPGRFSGKSVCELGAGVN